MKIWGTDVHSRDWISIVAAIGIGPIFLKVGYSSGLVFGAAAITYFLCCMIVVPLLILVAGRLKLFVWQLAIVSLVFTVIEDNLRLNAIHRTEIPSIAFAFWVMSTLLSSPVPIYFLLRPLAPRQRYIVGAVIAAVALVLWIGLKRITG